MKSNIDTNKNNNVKYPEVNFFTITQLKELNNNMIPITLRFKVNTAVENREIFQIGINRARIGRPTLVFSKNTNVETLLEAKKAGVILEPRYDTITNKVVAEFNNNVASSPTISTISEKENTNSVGIENTKEIVTV